MAVFLWIDTFFERIYIPGAPLLGFVKSIYKVKQIVHLPRLQNGPI